MNDVQKRDRHDAIVARLNPIIEHDVGSNTVQRVAAIATEVCDEWAAKLAPKPATPAPAKTQEPAPGATTKAANTGGGTAPKAQTPASGGGAKPGAAAPTTAKKK